MAQPVYDDNAKAIVIDNGTSSIKAGCAGNDAPTVEIPTVVARAKFFQSSMIGMGQKRVYIGCDAKKKRPIQMNMSHPIERGIITNWNDMETIYQHLFDEELKLGSDEYPVLLTDVIDNSKLSRKRMTEIMFEKFNVPAMGVEYQNVLALFASGNTSGFTIDSGAGGTRLVPIEEGYIINHAIKTMKIGGDDITNHMIRFMNNDGFSFKSKKDAEIVQNIKESFGYVATDFEEECNTINFQKIQSEFFTPESVASPCPSKSEGYEQEYKLPDGQIISINDVRFKSVEILFTPDYCQGGNNGLSDLLYESIMTIADEELQKVMFNNVVLSGGSSMFPGLQERMTKELTTIAPASMKINIVAPPERKYSVWIGGSILASLTSFQEMWIFREEYDEAGAEIVHRKCK